MRKSVRGELPSAVDAGSGGQRLETAKPLFSRGGYHSSLRMKVVIPPEQKRLHRTVL
jgi:hypothetical protein